ncbi:MAG: hypothetical protein HYS26_03890 [Candidatus Kaiserbacteria bacterium]|nr:MAG: hypothetical protein HYS26_03890 [Candidatus Kaiserbacteria bacterium]
MRFIVRSAPLLFLATLFPQPAEAMTVPQLLGLFYLFVGLFLVAILLTFAAGFFVYLARLGTWPTHRETAIRVLEWAVTMAFVLIVLLGLVRLFHWYTQQALFVLGVLLIGAMAVVILRTAAAPKKKKEGGRDDEH